jgi:hypothetical protein
MWRPGHPRPETSYSATKKRAINLFSISRKQNKDLHNNLKVRIVNPGMEISYVYSEAVRHYSYSR